jgi:hypothetical protein
MIQYTLQDKKGIVIKVGKMKVIDKINPLEAEVKFEMFMLNTYPSFGKLTIHNCEDITDTII